MPLRGSNWKIKDWNIIYQSLFGSWYWRVVSYTSEMKFFQGLQVHSFRGGPRTHVENLQICLRLMLITKVNYHFWHSSAEIKDRPRGVTLVPKSPAVTVFYGTDPTLVLGMNEWIMQIKPCPCGASALVTLNRSSWVR